MGLILLVGILLCWFGADTVAGIQIFGNPSESIYEIDGRFFKNRTLSLQISNLDDGLSFPGAEIDIGNYTAYVRFNPPTFRFREVYLGSVNRVGRTARASPALTDDFAALANSSRVDLTGVVQQVGRRLLSIPRGSEVPQATKMQICDIIPVVGPMLAIAFFGNDDNDRWNRLDDFVAKQKDINTYTSLLQAQQDDWNKDIVASLDNINNVVDQDRETVRRLGSVVANNRAYTDEIRARQLLDAANIESLTSIAKQQNAALLRVAKATDAQAAQTRENLKQQALGLQSMAGTITALAGQVNEDMRLLANVTHAQITEQANLIAAITNTTQANMKLITKRLRKQERMLRDVMGTVIDMRKNADQKRLMVKAAQFTMDLFRSAGMVPFVGDAGSPARLNLTAEENTAFVERLSLNWIEDRSGQGLLPRFVQIDIVLNYQSIFLVREGREWNNWKDIIEDIGPAGCNPELQECRSWFTIVENNCDTPLTAGVPQWHFQQKPNGKTAFIRNTDAEVIQSELVYKDNNHQNYHCSSPPNRLPFQTITNLDQWDNFMQTLCARKPFASGNPLQPARYRVFSHQRIKHVDVNYIADICSRDLVTLLDSALDEAEPVLGLPHVMWDYLERAYQMKMTYIAPLNDLIFGVLPTDLMPQLLPWQRTEAGETQAVTRATIAAFSEDRVPLYSLELEAREQSVTVDIVSKLDGSVVTQIQTQMVVDVALAGVLTQQPFIVAGKISPEMTSAYDTPDGSIKLDITANGRVGAINYNWIPADYQESEPWNITEFKKVYGDVWDANSVGDSVDLWEAPISQLDGRCGDRVSSSEKARGHLCLVMNVARWSHETVGSDTVLGLIPNAWTAIVTGLVIPEGEISIVLESGCPTVVVTQLRANQLVARLTNAASRSVVVDIEIKNSNSSVTVCYQLSRTTLAPNSDLYLPIPSCGNQIMTLFRVADGLPGSGPVCPNGVVNASVDPNFVANINTPASLGMIRDVYVQAQDESLSTQMVVMNRLVDLVRESIALKDPSALIQIFLDQDAAAFAAWMAANANHSAIVTRSLDDTKVFISQILLNLQNTTSDPNLEHDLEPFFRGVQDELDKIKDNAALAADSDKRINDNAAANRNLTRRFEESLAEGERKQKISEESARNASLKADAIHNTTVILYKLYMEQNDIIDALRRAIASNKGGSFPFDFGLGSLFDWFANLGSGLVSVIIMLIVFYVIYKCCCSGGGAAAAIPSAAYQAALPLRPEAQPLVASHMRGYEDRTARIENNEFRMRGSNGREIVMNLDD